MFYKALYGDLPLYKCLDKDLKSWKDILHDMKELAMPGNFDNEFYVGKAKSNICMQALHLGWGCGGSGNGASLETYQGFLHLGRVGIRE